ncbi:MAG: cytochrome C [Alphaproteobacteria bacterium]|nr:cytochrome C [Alphaproteobacteria bacterium]
MAQIFSPRATTIAVIVLVALVSVPVVLIAYIYQVHSSPYATHVGIPVAQPIPFSHAHHVGDVGLDCRYCHTGVETSAFAGLPPTSTCMTCHSQLWTNAAMLAPVRESLAKGKPIRWNRVHDLPDYVYFDHSVHIANGVGCSSCHGDVSKMPLTRKVKPLTMGWCLSCHENPAPHLRPQAEIFNPHWKPGPDHEKEGRMLMAHYGIDKDHLTDCSVCHR